MTKPPGQNLPGQENMCNLGLGTTSPLCVRVSSVRVSVDILLNPGF